MLLGGFANISRSLGESQYSLCQFLQEGKLSCRRNIFHMSKNVVFCILVYTYLLYSLISYGKAIPRQVVHIQVSLTSLHFSLVILARLNLKSGQVFRISRCLAATSELLLCI